MVTEQFTQTTTQNGDEDRLTLEEAIELLNMASSAQRLISLQELSSDYATAYEQTIRPSQQSLSDLANEVGLETIRLAKLARGNRRLLIRQSNLLDRQYEALLDKGAFDTATKRKIISGMKTKGGFARWVVSCIDTLEKELPALRQRSLEIADRGLDEVDADVGSQARMHLYLICGLYGGAAGAGAATGNVAVVFMALAGAANAGCFG